MEASRQNFRIDKISIRDYKGIDSLDLEFPRPKFEGDPDIFVIGSRNGLGKTSVLECCAWGLVSVYFSSHTTIAFQDSILALSSSLVRGTQKSASSSITISHTPDCHHHNTVIIDNDGMVLNTIDEEKRQWHKFWQSIPYYDQLYLSLNSFSFPTPFVINYSSQIPNPSIDHLFLFFPDNRFLLKGMVPLKELQSGKKEMPQISDFKIQTLQAIMGKSGLLEGQDKKTSEERFDFLNRLVSDFAKCELSPQLKQGADSSLDIRVRAKDAANQGTYSFDGLSSGQKEMISTLFLIWENTRHASKVVLIDEPEQHLNAEWHRLFVHTLHKIAPWNQYILATHSKHIVSAVDEDHRIMLVPDKE